MSIGGLLLYYLITKQNVVNRGNINTGNVPVAVLVAIDNGGVVIVEQVVVERCNVHTANMAVAVDIASNHVVFHYELVVEISTAPVLLNIDCYNILSLMKD